MKNLYLAAILLPALAFAQHHSAKNLSPAFCKAAMRATDAIAADNISSGASPTPTTDRIDEASAIAVDSAEKSFVLELRIFYVYKLEENLFRHVSQAQADVDTQFQGGYRDREEYKQQVSDNVAQDRDLSKIRLKTQDCASELRENLKMRIYADAPEACSKDLFKK
jgi:hypothetical protein